MIRSRSVLVLAALAAGMALGLWLRDARGASALIEPFGGLWLNALRMTVAPLLFALLVTGVASFADAAAAGRLAGQAAILFSGLLIFAALYSVAAANGLIALWPVDRQAAAAFLASLHGAASAEVGPPSFGQWIESIAPANVIRSAANDDVLPLAVFAVIFGFAVTRLREDSRDRLVAFFRAAADTMIVIVGWVLWAAPAGVFALAVGVGARAGLGAAGVLAHYIAIVSLTITGVIAIAYVLATTLARVSIGAFAAAIAPAQAVAISTQSSLASLPAMIEAARKSLRTPAQIVDLALPLAVAVFRLTSPVANLAVAFFIAALYGVTPDPLRIVGAIAVSFAVSVGSVGLPGQVSFFTSLAPICLTLGLPLDLLGVLLAVEVIPDIFRTVGNVTGDLAATAILHRQEGLARTGLAQPASADQ
jgi:Na+/H+-dicarboxylate symporter